MNMPLYSNDESYQKQLNDLNCEMNIYDIKAFLLGSILAIDVIPPSKVIQEILKTNTGDEIIFEEKEQGMLFYGDTMGLWNIMAEYQNSRVFPLRPLATKCKSHEEIISALNDRKRDIHYFLHGLEGINGSSSLYLDDKATEIINELKKLLLQLNSFSDASSQVKTRPLANEIVMTINNLEDYWNKNFVTLANSLKAVRVRQMSHIQDRTKTIDITKIRGNEKGQRKKEKQKRKAQRISRKKSRKK